MKKIYTIIPFILFLLCGNALAVNMEYLYKHGLMRQCEWREYQTRKDRYYRARHPHAYQNHHYRYYHDKEYTYLNPYNRHKMWDNHGYNRQDNDFRGQKGFSPYGKGYDRGKGYYKDNNRTEGNSHGSRYNSNDYRDK